MLQQNEYVLRVSEGALLKVESYLLPSAASDVGFRCHGSLKMFIAGQGQNERGYNMHGQFVSIKPWSDELFEVTIQSGKQKLHGLARNGPTFDANGNPAKTSLQICLHSRNRQRVARRNVRMTTWLLLRAFFVPCLSAPRCFMFMQICNFNLVTNLLLHNLLGTCWGMCLLDMCKSFCRFHNIQ